MDSVTAPTGFRVGDTVYSATNLRVSGKVVGFGTLDLPATGLPADNDPNVVLVDLDQSILIPGTTMYVTTVPFSPEALRLFLM